MSLPSPPVLKTTIIQLNKELDPEDDNNNYEILTNDYNNYGSSNTSDAGSILRPHNRGFRHHQKRIRSTK